jgi:hypothetical protein
MKHDKKLGLGIDVLSLDDEFTYDPHIDKTREKQSIRKSRLRKANWWRRNAKKMNRLRNYRRGSTVRNIYLVCKENAKQRNQAWDFSYDEWMAMWSSAGFVTIVGTETPSNPKGKQVTAFAKRGPNKDFNTYMRRRDISKGWSLDNCEVVYRDKVLIAGSEVLCQQLETNHQ